MKGFLPPLWVLLLLNVIGFLVVAAVRSLNAVDVGELTFWLQVQFAVLVALAVYGLWERIAR